ncbi:MAG: hypothetical protein Q7R65_00330 [bacterium]|nr:hypothetical protein [bacterium]
MKTPNPRKVLEQAWRQGALINRLNPNLGRIFTPSHQTKVISGYWKRHHGLLDERALHMFFSPLRVPTGLTNVEVAICVNLYRSGIREVYRQKRGSDSLPLDLKWAPRKRMTRKAFKNGLFEFCKVIVR